MPGFCRGFCRPVCLRRAIAFACAWPGAVAAIAFDRPSSTNDGVIPLWLLDYSICSTQKPAAHRWGRVSGVRNHFYECTMPDRTSQAEFELVFHRYGSADYSAFRSYWITSDPI
jgi:hypothetical protein